ncbi:MAG: phosphoribosylformylglycinamidine cyclo-ligase, partial [Planctomycetota bacterium]
MAKATYKDSGVDLDVYRQSMARLPGLMRRTHTPRVLPAEGGFAGLFQLDFDGRLFARNYRDPVLVACTDGVGTKLKVAQLAGRHNTVGIDLVAMCVNDVLAQGAEPLFFLDYYASGKLEVDVAADVVEGIAKGCVEAGCALIGGETAEMPGHYAPGDYDLAGFVVGAVNADDLLPRDTIQPGDTLLALPSSGVHSNGFSLVRKCAAERNWRYDQLLGGVPLGEALLAPTRIYVKPVLAALAAHGSAIKGIAHITGGGITGNVPRMLPENLAATIERAALPQHPIMTFLQAEAALSDAEMAATFNFGVGLVLAVSESAVAAV